MGQYAFLLAHTLPPRSAFTVQLGGRTSVYLELLRVVALPGTRKARSHARRARLLPWRPRFD